MPKEIELKLSLTPKAARTLGLHPLLAEHPHQRQRLCNTYYDTAALALTAARVAVRFRYKGERCLLTVKSAETAPGGLAERSEWEVEAEPGIFDFSAVDNAALRERLQALQSQLLPLFTTDFVRDTWQVQTMVSEGVCDGGVGERLSGTRPVHIEVALDRGSIASTGIDGTRQQETLCELELELITGQPADLFALASALQPEFNLHPSLASKAERGYCCFLQTPLKPIKARASALSTTATPTSALRQGLLEALAQLQGNQAAILRGESHPEFVHQARVGLRRLHSLLKTGEPLLPAGFIAQYFSPFKPLMQRLGQVRNIDVLLQETLPALQAAAPASGPWGALAKRLARQRTKHACSLQAQLSSAAHGAAVLQLTAALHGLNELPDAPPLADFAVLRLRALMQTIQRQAVFLMSQENPTDPQEAKRHQLRLACKRLRYSLALYQPLWDAAQTQPYLQSLVTVQALLGHLNDLATARRVVASLSRPMPEATFFLAGWAAAREQVLMQNFLDALAAFLDAAPPSNILTTHHNP